MRIVLYLPYLLLALAPALTATTAYAQRWETRWRGDARPIFAQANRHGRMSDQERQRLRDEMNSARRDVYRDRNRGDSADDRRRYQRRQPPTHDARERYRPAPARMSPVERERLRRDLIEANRRLERRRHR